MTETNATAVTAEEVEKELKEALAFGFALAEAIDMADADGTINMADFPFLISPLTLMGPAIEGLSKIKAIGTLSQEKRMAIVTWAKNDLDLRHDPTEEKVEAIFEMLVRLYGVYEVFKK